METLPRVGRGLGIVLVGATFFALVVALFLEGPLLSANFLLVCLLGILSIGVAARLARRSYSSRAGWMRSRYFLRITRRGAVVILVICFLAASAVNTGNNLIILILSALLASLVVSGVASSLVLHGLQISLKLPSAIHAGQEALFLVNLRNHKKWMPSFAIRLRSREREEEAEERTDFFVQEKSFPYIPRRGSLELQLESVFQERGFYSLEGFEMSTRFPFGFFVRDRKLSARGSIAVYPRLGDLASLLRRHSRVLGSREVLKRGSGAGIYKIRPYRSGDSSRAVHWKATAKVTQLMVKDFLSDEAPPTQLILERWIGKGEEGNFERAVSGLTTVMHHLRRISREFQFVSDQTRLRVGTDQADWKRVMQYLAGVQPDRAGVAESPPTAPHALIFSARHPHGIEPRASHRMAGRA